MNLNVGLGMKSLYYSFFGNQITEQYGSVGVQMPFGGAAMVLGHLSIVDHVHVSSGSLVSRSISEPGQYTGFYPLARNADWEKTAAVVRQLDTMRDRVRELEKLVRQLTAKHDSIS